MLKVIPDSTKYEIKPGFEERYRAILGDAYDDFMKYSLSYIRRSLRVNTLKISVKDLVKRMEKNWKLTPIPWCKEGFWFETKTDRRDIGNTLEHSLGYIYIQVAASMIPPVVLKPKPGEIVLDMCSSPGSKTTQIAQYMENKGILIANDINGLRMKPLGINTRRIGLTNIITTMMHGHQFFRMGETFDKILVDAPCSGTGTIRKSLKTLRMWNPGMIQRISKEQRRLIEVAFRILKPGGTMVYSTCSCEPEENEKTVDSLLGKFDNAKVMDIDLPINRAKPIMEWEGVKFRKDVSKVLRIWPHDNNTEGFFIAKIKKEK
ncbi:RsmB/NOP family class I SAM-dependent RNA methyltransferase [archaeon]|jgi:tRNA (cytosine49-C5)-methyltransferase|nr:RsmB/NOP family class I SAM-dependent RNA methyltransferase [archaeon]MBT4350988.1 RsmB/NOP family class I SAM-dependent RNA methyltransferase [archaeon]MBT4648596.1 RsmB/NOP family class I SAM-dependent RNA methyltransferase [archaeon]MBT6821404.1 RsmB/NOP family class I SAM-dependent RNA methyltransferase [archaeon]MBT7392999.1 RsmB/NOP family class I SAM-dependent RNA methyltransferase [archaeon]